MTSQTTKSNREKMRAIEEIYRDFLSQLDQLKGRRLKIMTNCQKRQDKKKIDQLRSQL